MPLFDPAIFDPDIFDTGEETGVATCVLYTDLLTSSGLPLVGKVGVLIIESLPENVGGGWIEGAVLKAVSDTNGRITWSPVIRGARVLVRVDAVARLEELTVPNAATAEI